MSARSSASASRPITGGALSYIDFMGAKAFVALCQRLRADGDRFAPPKIVLDMAATGGTFYGRARRQRSRVTPTARTYLQGGGSRENVTSR